MDTPTALTPTSHFFTSLRTRLHYLDWGNSAAPVLILVHGGFDHGRSWDWTARALAKDYHVIAPDLRGHGDSAWSPDGSYMMANYLYDLAQLVDLLDRPPVTIVGHSLGGSIALRYAGLFPEKVQRIVALEGLGLSPDRLKEKAEEASLDVWRRWIDTRRANARRTPRRYATIEAAIGRMRERNEHLSVEQALHLTIHGVNRNEDGSWSNFPMLATGSITTNSTASSPSCAPSYEVKPSIADRYCAFNCAMKSAAGCIWSIAPIPWPHPHTSRQAFLSPPVMLAKSISVALGRLSGSMPDATMLGRR